MSTPRIRVPPLKSMGKTRGGQGRLPAPSDEAHKDKVQRTLDESSDDEMGGAEGLAAGGHQDPPGGDTAQPQLQAAMQELQTLVAALSARLAVAEGALEAAEGKNAGLVTRVGQLEELVVTLRGELAAHRRPMAEVQQFVADHKSTAILVTAHATMSAAQVVEACAFAAQAPAGALQVTLVAPVGKPFTVDCRVGLDGCMVGAVVQGGVSGAPAGGADSGVAVAGPGQSQGGASGGPLPRTVAAVARFPPGTPYQVQRQLWRVELSCQQGHRAMDGSFRLAGHSAFSGVYINEDLPLELRQERRAILSDPSFKQEKDGLKGDGKVLRWRQGLPWWKLRRDPDTHTHLHMFAITKERLARRKAATTGATPPPPSAPSPFPPPPPADVLAPTGPRADGASTSGTRPPSTEAPRPSPQ